MYGECVCVTRREGQEDGECVCKVSLAQSEEEHPSSIITANREKKQWHFEAPPTRLLSCRTPDHQVAALLAPVQECRLFFVKPKPKTTEQQPAKNYQGFVLFFCFNILFILIII